MNHHETKISMVTGENNQWCWYCKDCDAGSSGLVYSSVARDAKLHTDSNKAGYPNASRPSVVFARRDNDSVILTVEVEHLGGTPPATRRFEFRLSEVTATTLFDELGIATGAWSDDGLGAEDHPEQEKE